MQLTYIIARNMYINYYTHVNSFVEYKQKLEVCDENCTSLMDSYCKQVDSKFLEISYFSENCPKAISFLEVQGVDNIESLRNIRCLYLYFWIFYVLYKGINEYDKIKKLFEGFLEAYAKYDKSICEYYKTNITSDLLEKLKDIHDMNSKIKSISEDSESCKVDKCKCAKECYDIYRKYEDICNSNSDNNFCDALNNIKEQYGQLMKTQNCNNGAPKMLRSFQKNNITVPIVSTILVILVILISLFILYKFTPYNSCFRRVLRREKNRWNNRGEYYNMLQSYKSVSTTPKKSGHNIIYRTV
ncbi:variable surface protein [Plasmodium gonderi]|uniref:Variable surface protein n=1 Tax=Plasmodium gonderi TaxID=77519 RepID=A0A1Y1JHL9_PLAGO|nr:variable surface protein [Plasmodium gonderi]GAW82016.1 variable surface protein [Plasmodium gonderi]